MLLKLILLILPYVNFHFSSVPLVPVGLGSFSFLKSLLVEFWEGDKLDICIQPVLTQNLRSP